MRWGRAIVVLAAVLATGCVSGIGYPGFGSALPYGGYTPPYYRDYVPPYYYGSSWGGAGMTRDEARDLARDQATRQRRLDREQEERRQQLLDKQAERRDRRQADDTWTKKNANWQRQQRQQQRERVQQERTDLKKKQDQQWQRSGW